ncbi:substrate-binding domain-containing protein [Puniceibacterium sp. IMCC21224]|uniref:substrate-binding domain-containing protein n=1 Tax=Puniceibacterium sp. IMCC21224 TaxID=1618204 RepID=UPI00064D9692|nr:substrate-binding domain-containing protein [Puniceibacterium sp. IMCC21224]KMK65478.1 amino acid ABC transporter substrate-binding protein, PAAT family [Puniceibacterium sp. IMCC21224]
MPAWAKIISGLVLVSALLISRAGPGEAQTSDLVSKTAFRVCADPANFPMSNKEGTGFENKLADYFAATLDLPLQYEWYPMATGFIRNSLAANKCDVVIGYAQGHELVLNTNHYMTSAYALVVPRDGPLAAVTNLSDPALKGLRIGIIAGSPPATHMARNGLLGKAKAYNLVVDRRHESPTVDLLNDVKSGDTAAAILWGPIAGPMVKQEYPDLMVIPLLQETLPPRLFFRITMGVRLGEKVWQRKLNSLIRRNQAEIDAILIDAGVPLINDMGTAVMDQGQ